MSHRLPAPRPDTPALGSPLRRRLIAAAAAGPIVAAAPGAHAQSKWPAERPVRLICPFPPGGNSDALARVLADRLREHLKANVLVDNRPGGTTQVGIEAGARAEPDGYTMTLATATTFTVLPNLRKLPFDLSSFEFAGGVADYIAFITVRKGLGVKTLQEFVALAKQNPGKFTWGSAGSASAGHIYGEMLKKSAGIDLLHVPFKGSADAANALVGEQIDMIIDGTGLGLARGGRAVLLATFFGQRHPEVPDVPAITETGVPVKLTAGGWGIAYPKGTPAPIVAQTGAALEKILAEPETREKLLRASVVATWSRPGDYRNALESARAYYAELLSSIGMKQEG
jgi:tripartite-type tricarboxylate transporter receptor subunit TctC